MDEDSDVRSGPVAWLTLPRLIAGAFLLVTTVSGATFAVTKLATDSHICAVQLQNAMLDNRVRELEAELGQLQATQEPEDGKAQPYTQETSVEPTPSPGAGEVAVTFESPTAGSAVPQFVDVKYSVKGKVPVGCRAILFVRDPLGQYWSWGSASGGYHPRVQLGVATDGGRPFELGVLVTRTDVQLGKPLTALPSGNAYGSIVVKRR